MKIRSVAVTALLALSGLISGQAAAFTFDPDGAGPIAPVIMDVFDWAPRNGLIVNGVAFSTTGAQPSYYGQSRLNSLMNQGANIAIPGLGEYTIVMGYGENGLGSVTNVANFSLNPSSSTNFFRIYYDPSNNSSNINGTGFDDGTLVLSGTINDASVTYINGQGQTQQPLDGFLTNNYPGVTTIIGSGTNAVTFNVAFANPAFFPVEQPSVLKYNESNVTPYQQTDPSHQFAGAIQGSVILPAIGAQNGISGPDFQVQVDGNMSVAVVPQAPAIKIVKVPGATSGFANGADANDPNAGDAPQIAIGNTVLWTYRVTNTGNVTLNNVLVTDDQGVAVTCPATTLAAGASMDCTASGAADDLTTTSHTTVLGVCGGVSQKPLYRNKGTVAGQTPAGGTVTAEDLSHYCKSTQNPKIDLTKYVSVNSDKYGNRIWEDAYFPTGPIASVCGDSTKYGSISGGLWSFFLLVFFSFFRLVVFSRGTFGGGFYKVGGSYGGGSYSGGSYGGGATYTCEVGPVQARTGQHTDTGKVTAKGGSTTVFDTDDAIFYG